MMLDVKSMNSTPDRKSTNSTGMWSKWLRDRFTLKNVTLFPVSLMTGMLFSVRPLPEHTNSFLLSSYLVLSFLSHTQMQGELSGHGELSKESRANTTKTNRAAVRAFHILEEKYTKTIVTTLHTQTSRNPNCHYFHQKTLTCFHPCKFTQTCTSRCSVLSLVMVWTTAQRSNTNQLIGIQYQVTWYN